ncbi:MAG TPA: 2OG-Fe(II) oxygenase [Burkholderiales bacterium]
MSASSPAMDTFIREYMLSDPSICDALVELFKKAVAANLVLPGVVGADVVDPKWKRSTDLGMGVAEKHWNLREFRFDAYMQEVSGFINRYIEELVSHGGSFQLKYPPQIQWYKPGEGFYAWHVDGAHGHTDRALVFTTYLNDVTDGGGTEFHYQRKVTSPVKGNTVIFPAALTHVHRGVVSPTQHKYLLTGWLCWA